MRLYTSEIPNPNDVLQAIEWARLAPSSSNMQLYEFYVIRDIGKLQKLNEYCLNQNTTRTAPEMIVVVARPDLWRQRAKYNADYIEKNHPKRTGIKGGSSVDYFRKLMPILYFNDYFGVTGFFKKIMQFCIGLIKPTVREVSKSDVRVVVHKSAALAAQNFMNGLKALGYDSCPIEGFDSLRVKSLLNLPFRAEINMVISYGKGTPEGVYNERIRVPLKDVLNVIE